MFVVLLFSVWISDKKNPFRYITFSVFGYQMKTPLLVFVILLFGVWISDETLLPVFVILHLGVWISDKTPLLVFVILLFGYRCLKIR